MFATSLTSLRRGYIQGIKELAIYRMLSHVTRSFDKLICHQLHHQCSPVVTLESSDTQSMKTLSSSLTKYTIELFHVS